MRLEGLHRASITESPLCGISVATQLPHNPRLKLLRFSERRLSWRRRHRLNVERRPVRSEQNKSTSITLLPSNGMGNSNIYVETTDLCGGRGGRPIRSSS